MLRVTALVVGLLAAGVHAISSSGSSVLVLIEPKLKRDDYSLFFNGLEERGFNLTFRSPKESSPVISEYGVPAFSHAILFTPTTKTLPQDLSSQTIVSLLSAEPPVNFLVALGAASTTTQLASLAAEFSLSLPPPNTPLVSHFPPRSGPHTTIPITIPPVDFSLPKSEQPPPVLTSTDIRKPILFSGVPFYPSPNPLLVPILAAPAESVATDTETDKSGADALVDAAEKGGEGLWAGKELQVVSGFQARTGARVVFAGGVSLFSDEFANAKTVKPDGKEGDELVATSNARFVKDISDWAFQANNVARIADPRHYIAGDREKTQLDKYTINTEVTFEIHLQTWNAQKGAWSDDAPTPSGAALDDLQLEFTMLDPHVRTIVGPVVGRKGWYSVTFRIPDRHGVFKFLIDWRRKGYTNLHYSNTVSVVPRRHDEYPRFISAAWPYYAGAISTSIGFVVFSVIYLGGEVDRKTKGKSKTTKAE